MPSSICSSRDETQDENTEITNLIHKENPSLWAEDIFGLTLDDWQIEMLESPKNRICLNIHRQAGKSFMSSLICLHRALFYPHSLSLIVAPSLTQSQENFGKIRDLIDQLAIRPVFDESTKLRLRLDNHSRVVCLPGGTKGKTIRGFSRPDVIVEDEAAQCSEELFIALTPMMATNPECKFIMASTPFGQREHFYKTWMEGGPEWLKLKVVASDCTRITKAFLEEERIRKGPYMYAQEYEGQFVASSTQLISHESILKAHDIDIQFFEI
jgi:hypothetical protein